LFQRQWGLVLGDFSMGFGSRFYGLAVL